MSHLGVQRVIGTSYQGKEPFEYTADVLRIAVRTCDAELGFEGALTSRPFTGRTFIADRPGAMAPGRGAAAGAERASADLADGLAALESAGFRVIHSDLVATLPLNDGGRTVVVGPLRAMARWVPAADRLVVGDVWRHVIVDEVVGDDLVCLDPLVGGYTTFPRAELARPGVDAYAIAFPDEPVDGPATARRCFTRGAVWRSGAVGDDRDENGLAQAAMSVDLLVSGGAPRRLRLSLANYALHAMRVGALLGACGPLSMDQVALADLLQEVIAECQAAQLALSESCATDLGAVLRRLAVIVGAIGELYRREAVVAA